MIKPGMLTKSAIFSASVDCNWPTVEIPAYKKLRFKNRTNENNFVDDCFSKKFYCNFLINHNSIKQTVKQKRARVLIKVQGVEKRVDIVVNSKSRIAVGQCADCNQELTVIAHPNA